jgi:SAM-dependent methyltransferase
MLLVAPVLARHRLPAGAPAGGASAAESGLFDSFNAARSNIPAVTHVDFSARIQTVDERHGKLRALLQAFHKKTGCPVLVNTSFNLSWEPIVCEPGQAYHTFMQSDMDALVLENCLVLKSEQPRGFPSLDDAATVAPQDNQNPWVDPLTGQSLTVTKKALVNTVTGATYPVENGVPRVLLVESTDETGEVTQTVRRCYEQNPCPNYEDIEGLRGLMDNARRGVFDRMLNEQIPYDARVLEIGCGTGQLTNFLAVSGRSVLGTDLSWNSLMQAQKFKEVHGIRQATFAQMNLFRPALRDGFFDIVICKGVLHQTAAPKAGFGRISRLLRPGGYIVVGLQNRYNRALQFFGSARSRENGLGGGGPDPKPGPPGSYHSLGEVMGWLEEFGLEFVNAVPKPASGPGLTDEEKLFERKQPGTTLSRAMSQLKFLPGGCGEGGSFIVIARRA